MRRTVGEGGGRRRGRQGTGKGAGTKERRGTAEIFVVGEVRGGPWPPGNLLAILMK